MTARTLDGQRPLRPRRHQLRNWFISAVVSVATTYGIDLVATAFGLLLVSVVSAMGVGHPVVVASWVASYALWWAGLRVNVHANLTLLERTGKSTNIVSKAAFDIASRARGSRRVRLLAAGAAYVGTELAMEVPYYLGAFGATALTDTVTADDALIFLTGANLGAAAAVYAVARTTRKFLARPFASFDTDWDPGNYLADYYTQLEPDERETIAYFVEAVAEIPPGRPVLFFGVGPTLHHVFLAAPLASEIHLGDYLPSNLAEIQRWLDGAPGAHDWTPFVRYTLQCEGIATPTDAQIRAREDLTRGRITRLVEVDGRLAEPSAAHYPLVISAYCADSATSDHPSWARFMAHILDRVSGGGLFVTAALRLSHGYRVGESRFPSAVVDEEDFRTLFDQTWGAGSASVEARNLPAQATHGYTGIVLAHARRPDRPPFHQAQIFQFDQRAVRMKCVQVRLND